MSKKQALNVRMSLDLHKWLQEHSRDTGLSMSAIAVLALMDYRHEKEQLVKSLMRHKKQ